MNRTLSPSGKPDADASHHGADCLDVVRQRLVSLVEHESLPAYRNEREGLAVHERAHAGQVLGGLGDTRPGVGVKDGLPDIDWIQIPAREFPMGGGEYVCDVGKASYRIGRYPITVAQYQPFMDDKGYEQRRFWTKAGWEWCMRNKINGPEEIYNHPIFQTRNHPRVGVSLFEAEAFCCWLSEKLGRDIRLPSGPEWERAGSAERGENGRVYLNCLSAGLYHTSAVGLFPSDDGACGAADMVCNYPWVASDNPWSPTEWLRLREDDQRAFDTGFPREWLKDREDSFSAAVSRGATAFVSRGGGWDGQGDIKLVSSRRSGTDLHDRYHFIGFRCVGIAAPAR